MNVETAIRAIAERKPVGDRGAAVDERGGRTTHLDLVVGDLRADVVHEMLSDVRVRLNRQVDERVAGAGLCGRGRLPYDGDLVYLPMGPLTTPRRPCADTSAADSSTPVSVRVTNVIACEGSS